MKRAPEQVVWNSVHDWLRKAEGDLRAAEHLLEIEMYGRNGGGGNRTRVRE
jgi:hypothetical protein